ncbi:centrosomal protein of 120 kDa-like [Ylistrum balloti]|uniref:centrosomal protein of 120 kDa-like n=1 Tax=Ylistrum balloti TaxID=509963 RepID=UPI002905DE2E|nr:centrosomal protein of 120 kDa-like [Ylistrum balloti]
MVEKGRFLVVISVLEGRRFPKRPRHQIIAEARFDGELLSTDPVNHVENPDFTQELAWELDKKGLQQHRLQRTSIKIQCYAYDNSSTMKEAIGYVVLDLRSVTAKQTVKWYPLLHSKYSKNKPEIKLSIYLDEDKSGEQPSFRAKEAPARIIEDGAGSDEARFLRPILNEEEGYYQIGPASKCKDQFVLSVTIAYAANLPQLIPSTQPLPPDASGYFFYFSLLGNDVTNEVFHDLINPNFPAERASVRIRTSIEALRQFFTHQPGIQVHLCCGEQSLGSCEVPLNSLLQKNSTEIYMKPVAVEGSFQLIPPNKTKQQIPTVPNDMSPAVGVSVILRKEDMAMKSPVKESPPRKEQEVGRDSSPPRPKESPKAKKSPSRGTKTKSKTKGKGDKDVKPKQVAADDYPDDFDEENTEENLSSIEEDRLREKAAKKSDQRGDKPAKQSLSPPTASSVRPSDQGTGGSIDTTTQHVAIPPQAHHFTFSIDLRSIKDMASTNTLYVFIRYTYPFFGSAAPILTHPPVEIRKGMEVLLPQSFCAFDFACTVAQLQETFLRVPLIVEVWHRDKQLSKDVLLGTARLPLGNIITADKMRIASKTGSTGWRQACSDRVTVQGNDSDQRKVGEVSTVLSLEDWGTITTQQIIVQQESSGTQSVAESLGQNIVGVARAQSQTQQAPSQVSPQAPRESVEYKTALELEMWKEGQEKMFENQLKQKETVYMKALAEEWKKRDKEREILMKKKMAEYAQLEDQLRKTLSNLEKREKQLAANEQEVARMKTDLQREHDRKLQDVREASRRMKEDCDHQVELERLKCKEIEGLIDRYKREIAELEKKNQNQEKEFAVYKEQQNTKPEVRLQSEINLLTLEKVELERKLDAIAKSKVHYKQQWGRALKELARLKQKEQVAAKTELKRQQHELEHMRLRYLAAEEKEVVKSEKKELEDLKNELNRLRQMEEEKAKSLNHSLSPREYSGTKGDDSQGLDEHITRLIEERDTLLRTGVYTTQDGIIAELDRQIRESMVQKKTNAL